LFSGLDGVKSCNSVTSRGFDPGVTAGSNTAGYWRTP